MSPVIRAKAQGPPRDQLQKNALSAKVPVKFGSSRDFSQSVDHVIVVKVKELSLKSLVEHVLVLLKA